jgi:hypothetical protein
VVTVELKDAAGRAPVHFHIMASSGLPESVVSSQLELMQQLAPSTGMRYYFLVTTDWVRGWDVTNGALVFRSPTLGLFGAYARNSEDKIRNADPQYLAELTQAWVADLTYHWQSRGASAPGEGDMQNGGVLGLVRSAASAVTASL